MNISNNNSTSFGINMIRFEDKASKNIFNAKNRFIQPEKINDMWDHISKIKPKHGPDVDVYIGKSNDGLYNVLTAKYETNNVVVQTFRKITGVKEDENSVNSIIHAFKDLVKQIDEYRAKGL